MSMFNERILKQQLTPNLALASTGLGASVNNEEYTTKVIKENLLIILSLCNIFSLFVCVSIIYNFMSAIANSKEDRMKRKSKLYYNSASFIFFVLLMIMVLLIFPFIPTLFYIGDISMDVSVCFALLFWWTQWKQSVYLHIQNKYLQLLKTDDERSRMTFMARIANLGRKFLHDF